MKFINVNSILKIILLASIFLNVSFSIKFNSKKTLLEALTTKSIVETDDNKNENKSKEKEDENSKLQNKVAEEFTLNSTRNVGLGFQKVNAIPKTDNKQFEQQKLLTNDEKKKLINEINSKSDLEDWFMISSLIFQDKTLFPPVYLSNGSVVNIKTTSDGFRINDRDCLAYKNMNLQPSPVDEGKLKPPRPDELNFWFRLVGKFLYYSISNLDMNIIDAINIQTLTFVSNPIDLRLVSQKYAYCVNLQDINNANYIICSYERANITKFYCIISRILGMKPQGDFCTVTETDPTPGPNIVYPQPDPNPINIIQEIIIPLPTRSCNDIWDYQQNGRNWECKCRDGIQQSPIDLPYIQYSRIKEISTLEFDLSPFKQIDSKSDYDLIETDYHPNIEFYPIESFSRHSTLDGALVENTNIKFMLRNGALKILHNKMGKMVTPLGEVFYAEEILFHTPSEHTIGGKKFDMEIQVIFYGQTKGDISKQAIVSYLFESSPGFYNSFIDDLDIQNLPDREIPTKELRKDLLISKIFKTRESTNESILSELSFKPFSFYLYQGSLTFPPCSENTQIYVNTEILKLSPTIIQLFQEAIIEKPKIDRFGNISSSTSVPFSNRSVQPLNGRKIMFYDHTKYCDEPKPEKAIKEGHFEKITKDAVKYIYVKDSKPTGIPGSIVVTKEEAIGSGMQIQPHY